MTAETIALESRPDGTVIPIRVTPKSSRARVLGVREGRLCVAVEAAPEKGKANQALVKFLAKRLHLPRSRVVVLSGETARSKRVLVAGVDAAAVRAGIAADA